MSATGSQVTKTVYEFIKHNSLINQGDHVVVGLSGGADSVALLHILHTLSDKLQIKVTGAHFNHMMRGDEANRDEQFSRGLCESLGIPFHSAHGKVLEYAERNKLSTEEAARELRYKFLHSICKITASHENLSTSRVKIATAHHANDNLETSMMRMITGTGLHGLTGIPIKNGNIVRPLLSITRSEIEQYLALQHIAFVTDSTNNTNDYYRNRVRHSIIPAMLQENPAAIKNSINTLEILRTEDEYIQNQADAAYKTLLADESTSKASLKYQEFIGTPAALRNRILTKILTDLGVSDRYASKIKNIYKLLDSPSGIGSIDLGNGIKCVKHIRANMLTFENSVHQSQGQGQGQGVTQESPYLVVDPSRLPDSTINSKQTSESLPCRFRVSGECKCGCDKTCSILEIPPHTYLTGQFVCTEGTYKLLQKMRANRNIVMFQSHTSRDSNNPIQIRTASKGDKITFSYGTKSLTKLFNESAILLGNRNDYHVVSDTENPHKILGIFGIGSAHFNLNIGETYTVIMKS